MIVRDNYSRLSWVYFFTHKSAAPYVFFRHTSGTSSRIEHSFLGSNRSFRRWGGGGSVKYNPPSFVGDEVLHRSSHLRTVLNSTGVAERALGLIEVSVHAARIQAADLFPTVQLPATASLYMEAQF